LDYLTEEFPELRIVVAHLGGENHNVVLTYAESNPNIFLDISRFSETSKRLRTLSPKDLLRSVRDGVPATNLIFGTDQVGVWNPEVSPEYLATCEVFSEGDCTQVFLSNALALFDDGRERILGQGTKDPD
jgi:predicted TIM-barrel fold metal-dependent hydrolase